MDDLSQRWGETVLKTAADMDDKLVLETTSERDGKPDTLTMQAMYEQQGPQTSL